MPLFRLMITLLLLVGLSVTTISCESEGPMEEAGENLDQAVDEAGDKIEEAGDELEEATD